MNLHQLRTFESVARNRSFTRAAAELSLTQPAVSVQIRALEESLGAELFERLGRDVGLTPVDQHDGDAASDGAGSTETEGGTGRSALANIGRAAILAVRR